MNEKANQPDIGDRLRPMPVETVNGLTPPLAGFDYLANSDEYPFQPRSDLSTLVNAWWLADACFLVYGDADFIEQKIGQTSLPAAGFRIQWIGDRDNNRGMALVNDDAMIIIFRGTQMRQHSVFDAAEVVLIDQNDLWTDSKFVRKACDAGGKVHHGFLSAFDDISDSLEAILSEKLDSQALWFSGHSLGGALAVIAATHFCEKEIQGVCTFGAPRVGNQTFASVLSDDLHHRFVHRDDWVTTVPPKFIGYRHGGVRREVPGSERRSFFSDVAGGAQSLVSAVKAAARELHVDFGELPMKINGIADHAPVYYATLLWNALVQQSEDES